MSTLQAIGSSALDARDFAIAGNGWKRLGTSG